MQKLINFINHKKRLFFTGFSMGLADLVPGVSGGTIALLFGIYEELLYSIKLVTGPALQLFIKREFKKSFQIIPFGFLVPVVLGIFIAIFSMVHVISYLLENQKSFIWSFFFGLVIGSIYFIAKRVKKWNFKRTLLLIIGAILTLLIINLPSANGNDSLMAIFFTGAIAIVAMILPGISGSLIMVILGQYQIIIEAVAQRQYIVLITFTIGAFLGLALFARLLSWLLKKHHSAVIAFLTGVLIGSLSKIWPWQYIDSNYNSTYFLPTMNMSFILCLILIIIGFSLVIILEKLGVTKEHNDIKNIK